MNSVHEPGPNGDSQTALSRKLGQKLSRVTKTPNWPSWAHRRAQACACLAVSWALLPCRGRGPRPSHGSGPRPCRRRRAPYRGPCQRRVVGAGAVSQRAVLRTRLPCPGLAMLYCNTSQPFLLRPVTIQFVCIGIQVFSPALQPTAIQYTVLRYSSPAAPNPYVTIHLGFTIQPFPNLLQYNPFFQNHQVTIQ